MQRVFAVRISIHEERQRDNCRRYQAFLRRPVEPEGREHGAEPQDKEKNGVDEFMPPGEDVVEDGEQRSSSGRSQKRPHKQENNRT